MLPNSLSTISNGLSFLAITNAVDKQSIFPSGFLKQNSSCDNSKDYIAKLEETINKKPINSDFIKHVLKNILPILNSSVLDQDTRDQLDTSFHTLCTESDIQLFLASCNECRSHLYLDRSFIENIIPNANRYTFQPTDIPNKFNLGWLCSFLSFPKTFQCLVTYYLEEEAIFQNNIFEFAYILFEAVGKEEREIIVFLLSKKLLLENLFSTSIEAKEYLYLALLRKHPDIFRTLWSLDPVRNAQQLALCALECGFIDIFLLICSKDSDLFEQVKNRFILRTNMLGCTTTKAYIKAICYFAETSSVDIASDVLIQILSDFRRYNVVADSLEAMWNNLYLDDKNRAVLDRVVHLAICSCSTVPMIEVIKLCLFYGLENAFEYALEKIDIANIENKYAHELSLIQYALLWPNQKPLALLVAKKMFLKNSKVNPLHVALKSSTCSKEKVKILMEAGYHPLHFDFDGKCAYSLVPKNLKSYECLPDIKHFHFNKIIENENDQFQVRRLLDFYNYLSDLKGVTTFTATGYSWGYLQNSQPDGERPKGRLMIYIEQLFESNGVYNNIIQPMPSVEFVDLSNSVFWDIRSITEILRIFPNATVDFSGSYFAFVTHQHLSSFYKHIDIIQTKKENKVILDGIMACSKRIDGESVSIKDLPCYHLGMNREQAEVALRNYSNKNNWRWLLRNSSKLGEYVISLHSPLHIGDRCYHYTISYLEGTGYSTKLHNSSGIEDAKLYANIYELLKDNKALSEIENWCHFIDRKTLTI